MEDEYLILIFSDLNTKQNNFTFIKLLIGNYWLHLKMNSVILFVILKKVEEIQDIFSKLKLN